MARYLVTGGAGFIGSHLCEALLAAEHEVWIIDNLSTGRRENVPDDAKLIVGDIQDISLMKQLMTEVHGCFHLAAIASVASCNKDWCHAHNVNVTATLHILDCARANAQHETIPIVYASSAAVYGNSQQLPMCETQAPVPVSAYGLHKWCCEQYARIANLQFAVPSVGLRLFNVYGPRQSPDSYYSGVITNFVNNLLQHKPLIFYGEGNQTRDFIWINDVVRGFMQAMTLAQTSTDTHILNICTGKRTSVEKIAANLSELFQQQPLIIHEPKKLGDITHSLGSPDLAKSVLGIQAEMPFARGLELLVKYAKSAFKIEQIPSQ